MATRSRFPELLRELSLHTPTPARAPGPARHRQPGPSRPRPLAILCWQAETLGRLLGVPVAPLVCVHGAHIQHGGLHAQGVAIVPATLLRSALGYDQVLSATDVEMLAATAQMRLRPAA